MPDLSVRHRHSPDLHPSVMSETVFRQGDLYSRLASVNRCVDDGCRKGVLACGDVLRSEFEIIAGIMAFYPFGRIGILVDEFSYDIALIIEKGYDQKYGARPLRRTIQSQIEDQLAEQVLEGSVKAGDTVAIEAEGDAFRFTVKTKESQPVS